MRRVEVIGIVYRVSHPDPSEVLTDEDWPATEAWFELAGMEIEEFEPMRVDGTQVVAVKVDAG